MIDGEAVILDLTRGDYYTLNGPGLDIWRLCSGKHDLEKIKSQIAVKYGISAQKSQADTEKFIFNLYKKKLIDFVL